MKTNEKQVKKILIFTNTDWHFYAHLLPIAIAAGNKGYEVKILTNVSNFKDKIERYNISVLNIPLKRSGINPFEEVLLLVRLIKILNQERPDILHNFTIKPIFYGSIGGFLCRIPQVINNFLGMGSIFISKKFSLRAVQVIFTSIISLIGRYKNMLFIVQNEDDAALIAKTRIAPERRIVKQCSVGIDTRHIVPFPEPAGKIIFALVARMIIDKGIYEFIEAAKILIQAKMEAEFWLIGDTDLGNKQAIDRTILENYHNDGYIKYSSYQHNIAEIWKKAHVGVLPSYREGLSRSLLEAGVYGRAVITTDAPGGRELVQHQYNGLLVKPKDAQDLAQAMQLLVINQALRKSLGKQIRQDILKNYDASFIAQKMISFYL